MRDVTTKTLGLIGAILASLTLFATPSLAAPSMPASSSTVRPAGEMVVEDEGDSQNKKHGTAPKDDVPPPPGGDNNNGNDGPSEEHPDANLEWHTRQATVDFREFSGTPDAGTIGAYAYDQCGPETERRIGANVTYQQLYDRSTGSYFVDVPLRMHSASCINLGVETANHTCVLKIDLSIEKTNNPNRGILAEKTVTEGGWTGGTSKAAIRRCDESSVRGVLSKKLTEYGRYKGTAVVHYRPVKVVVTTDPINNTSNREVTLGKAYTRNSNVYAQKTCAAGADGFRTGTSRQEVFVGDWTFTHTDCRTDTPPNPVRYSCVPMDPSAPSRTVNGKARNNAQLFRDGEANELRWSVLEPEGDFIWDGVARTRFLRNEDGTPWEVTPGNPLFSLNISKAKNNRFASNPTRTSWLKNGPHSTAYVRGYWASTAGQPTEITPVWRYEGRMRVRVPDGFEFNTETNQWEVTSYRNEYYDSTAECVGPRIRLNFVRSVTTN